MVKTTLFLIAPGASRGGRFVSEGRLLFRPGEAVCVIRRDRRTPGGHDYSQQNKT